jgi:hypothetical protein
MGRYGLLAPVFLVAMANRVLIGQAIYNDDIIALRDRLKPFSATAIEVEWNRSPAFDTAVSIDLITVAEKHRVLEIIKEVTCPLILVLGDSNRDSSLAEWMDDILQCPQLAILVLDSMDAAPGDLDRVIRKIPGIQIVFSERTARNKIIEGYRFAFDYPDEAVFQIRERADSGQCLPVDSAHLSRAIGFYGVTRYPIYRKPLPIELIPHFKHLRDLQDVNLDGVPVRDEDLRHFANMADLRRLSLGRTRIEGWGLNYLSRGIVELDLSLTDIRMAPLDRFDRLESLSAIRCSIDSTTLNTIGTQASLTQVNFSGTPISPDEIDRIIGQLHKLDRIVINDDAWPDERIAALRESYPNVSIIVRHGTKTEMDRD